MNKRERAEDILFLAKKVSKTMDSCFSKKLEQFDLTAQQGRIILYIYKMTIEENKSVFQKDIEARMSLSKSTVSGLVDRLENKGFIIRVKEKNSFSLLVTDKTISLIAELDKGRSEHQKIMLKNISEFDKITATNVLKQIIKNIEEGK